MLTNPAILILIGLNLVTLLVNLTSFFAIKFNDFRHLAIDLKKIETNIATMQSDVKILAQEMTNITVEVKSQKAKCEVRHK